jgi:hypothetical protein
MKKKKKIIICFEWEFMAKSERRDQKKKKKKTRDLTEFTVEHLLIFFRRNFTKNSQTFTCFEIPSLNLKNSQFSPINFQLLSI